MEEWIIFLIIASILGFVILLVIAAIFQSNYIKKTIEKLINESLDFYDGTTYKWIDEKNYNNLIKELRESIIDKRNGKIKQSVINRGPRKTKEIKNLVNYFVNIDRNSQNIYNNSNDLLVNNASFENKISNPNGNLQTEENNKFKENDKLIKYNGQKSKKSRIIKDN